MLKSQNKACNRINIVLLSSHKETKKGGGVMKQLLQPGESRRERNFYIYDNEDLNTSVNVVIVKDDIETWINSNNLKCMVDTHDDLVTALNALLCLPEVHNDWAISIWASKILMRAKEK